MNTSQPTDQDIIYARFIQGMNLRDASEEVGMDPARLRQREIRILLDMTQAEFEDLTDVILAVRPKFRWGRSVIEQRAAR